MKRLVNIIAYCLNPNHFHMILEQATDGGISEFMKRIEEVTRMVLTINTQEKWSLFQGVFKDVHIDTNEYLLHVSAYVNLNDRVHKLWRRDTQICRKRIELERIYRRRQYRAFARNILFSGSLGI